MEADAGDTERTRPIFDIYSTLPDSGYTFWDTYCNLYGGKTAVAMTLSLSPTDDTE